MKETTSGRARLEREAQREGEFFETVHQAQEKKRKVSSGQEATPTEEPPDQTPLGPSGHRGTRGVVQLLRLPPPRGRKGRVTGTRAVLS